MKVNSIFTIGKLANFWREISNLLMITLLFCSLTTFSQSSSFQQRIFGCHTDNLTDFEQFVVTAKKAGATHIQINAEDLPLAYWQMDPPDDPYPAWVISNPGLLKTFIPNALQPYIPSETANRVVSILEQRCQILRKYKLKAAFHTFEPQMLPDEVFKDHPNWKGPRVDHPRRSKKPRYAPSVNNPEVLALYTESINKFIAKCPEVEILVFCTNDSGAGLDWSHSLYAGPNGNPTYKDVPMVSQIKGLFEALQKGAREAGGSLILEVYNAKEDARNFAKKLDRNMAIDGYEGPSASRFKSEVDDLLYYMKPFAPIVGIPRPIHFLKNLERVARQEAPRLFVAISDRPNQDLYFKIYNRFWNSTTKGSLDNLKFLHKIAEEEVGKKDSEKLLELWIVLEDIEKTVELLDMGGTIFILGEVHQRWLTRPLVPFPSELKPEEKNYYRKHQFTAGAEEEADHLMVTQGNTQYTGPGGHLFIEKVMKRAQSLTKQAIGLSNDLDNGFKTDQTQNYELLTTRLIAFDLMLNNVRNVSDYQLQLDILKEAQKKPLEKEYWYNGSQLVSDVFLDTSTKLQEIVQREIENTSHLIKILEVQEPTNAIIDHAKTIEEEYPRLLGADLINQLKKKNQIMKSHFTDYTTVKLKG